MIDKAIEFGSIHDWMDGSMDSMDDSMLQTKVSTSTSKVKRHASRSSRAAFIHHRSIDRSSKLQLQANRGMEEQLREP
jgi:hypothetical protein